jgi:hypothetical protein
MNKLIFFILLFLSVAQVYGQKIDYPLGNRVTINYLDHMVYAHFTREDKTISVDDDKYYYWFAANDIKKTRGGYDGKILHGLYTAFYMNKNLKEKGKFHYGLKKGEWKEWYMNGELKEKNFYKKGTKSKSFTLYYTNGKIKQKGFCKNGQLDGKLKTYDSSSVLVKTEHYKKGILQPLKIKGAKAKKRKGLFRKKQSAVDNNAQEIPKAPEKRKWFHNPFKKKDETSTNKVEEKNKVEQKGKTEGSKEKKEKKSKTVKKKDEDSIRIRKMKKIVPADTNKSDI